MKPNSRTPWMPSRSLEAAHESPETFEGGSYGKACELLEERIGSFLYAGIRAEAPLFCACFKIQSHRRQYIRRGGWAELANAAARAEE
eukprot:8927448-Pyramimonas_sp.AAC.1